LIFLGKIPTSLATFLKLGLNFFSTIGEITSFSFFFGSEKALNILGLFDKGDAALETDT
jgi:hypothetical protein